MSGNGRTDGNPAGGTMFTAGPSYGLRLGWQPLWWDEGYSLYFATEPLGRMAALTAHDIHPPVLLLCAAGRLA